MITTPLFQREALAGPPYVTDDPEPVAFRHWEFYLASQLSFERDGWTGTAPHIEVNYGAAPNLQLHVITPLVVAVPSQGVTQYGYGDTELGAKYRFVQEKPRVPQIGTFPLVEIPTGNQNRGLGGGYTQVFIPVWVQKSIGKWSSYGGVGYWINPGKDNRNWWFSGWQVQRSLNKHISIGTEVFHSTKKTTLSDEQPETRFNIGTVIDFTENHHLLFSVGRTIQGAYGAQLYVAYQLTW